MPSQADNSQRQRAESALRMLFIGDALSMPVHWFYRPADIWRAFPPDGIRTLCAAPAYHPSSIMSLHSTRGGGRSSQEKNAGKQIVGDVILKGRAQYWNQSGVHYHYELGAGENTLNTWCAHWLISWLNERVVQEQEPLYSVSAWLHHYVDYMTAEPPRHPDTYAESYHRGFFANYEAGLPIEQCGAMTHDTPSMGALVTVAPLAMALLSTMPLEQVQTICRAHVWATHPDKLLLEVVDAYVKLIKLLLFRDHNDEKTIVAWLCEASAVVTGGVLKEAELNRSDNVSEQKLMRLISEDMSVVGGRYSLACYITDSWPSVCYLAARHFKSPKNALLINTNLGGENAHRGSVLGTLLGLISAEPLNDFYTNLAKYHVIDADINQWLDKFYS